MSWEWSRDPATGDVTLVDPTGATVGTFSPSSPPTTTYGAAGVPTDPDIRAEAAAHVVAEVEVNNIDIATAVEWAMLPFVEVAP